MANQPTNQVKIFNPDGSVEVADPSEFQPIPQASAIRSLGDTLLKFGRGATSATKALTDTAGANNIVSRGLDNVTDFISSGLSDEAVMNDQIAAKRLEDTQDAGIGAQLKAVGKNFLDNPLDTLAEGAGSIVPTAAAMIASKGRVNPANTGAAMGVAQGMGAVKGSIYADTKAEALNLGYSEQEAEQLAQDAQAYTGQNSDQIALGGALGYLAGKTGAESSSILTGATKDNATDLLRNTLKGFATEAGTEGLQGGQEQVAANLALQRDGADVAIDRGVAGQAASEAIAGGLTGGAFGAADTFMSQSEPTPQPNPREQLRNTLLAQNPSGAITQAAATAAATGAADNAILGLPLYAGEPLVTFPDGTTMTRAEAQQRYSAEELAAFEARVGTKQPSQGVADNVSDTTEQPITDVATGTGGLEPANDAGSAGNPVTQSSDTGTNGNNAATPTPSIGGDMASGTASGNADSAVKTFANAQEGDIVETGGVQFRKTGNGFERVNTEQQPAEVDAKANEAATSPLNDLPEPTQAQKDAGNYKVGRIKVGGLDISVENPDQSTRSGVDRDGNAWQSTMNGHYGYIKGVKARSPDKEHVDVNVKPSTPEDFAGDVYVINQKDPKTGNFDEPKVYIGYTSQAEAKNAYQMNYATGWQGFDSITQVPMAKFKEMLNDEQAFMKPVKPTLREQIAERKAGEVSEQFNSYRAWIEKGNTVSKGMIETIKMDERLNDGEADKLLAMVPKENMEEKKLEGLFSETGSKITSPLYVGLYGKGYKMLRLDDDKTYSDKGNSRYRTFEKDGVRVALTGQQVMFEHNGNALYGQGETNDVVIQFIGVDPDKRKQGRANKALKEIADIADEESLNVYIEPTSLDKSAMSKEQLAELYKKYGFDWVGEANKVMVRKPNQQKQSNDLVGLSPQNSITKEETEGLFGLPAKREKALKRIAEGRGWFGAQDKAKEFVRVNGLSDTHEVIKGSGLRWEIVEKKSSSNLTQQEETRYQELLEDGRRNLKGEELLEFENLISKRDGVSDVWNKLSAKQQNEAFIAIDAIPITNIYVPWDELPKNRLTIDLTKLIRSGWKPSIDRSNNELDQLKDLRANLSEQLQAQGTVTDARLEDRLAQVNRAIQEIENKQAEPVNDEKAKAKADFDSALGDLGDIFGKNLRSNITPEQEQKLIPVLTRLFDAAFRLGYQEFKQAAKFVLNTIRDKIGKEAADTVTIDHLQGAYIAMAGKYGTNATSKRDVIAVESKQEIDANENTLSNTNNYVKNEPTPTNEVNNDARANQTEPVPDGNTQSDLLPEQSRGGSGEPVVSRVARKSERTAKQQPVSGSLFDADGTGTASTSGSGESQPSSGSRETSNAGNQSGTTNVSDFEITDEVGLGEGGLTKKYRDNVDAIKIIKTLEAENRIATPEERIKLAKYVGFGALKGVFDRENKQWSKQYKELKELLTEDEYKAARASVLNAHYTAKSVVTAMYDAVNRLGFNGGRVLEPSLGSGNFFGLMPTSIRNKSQLSGVELDVITSRLAKYLYPNANIATATGFEAYQAPAGYFDLVIGNPPFGSERIFDTDKSPYSGFSIHNYFLAKGIDKLRDGGVMAVVVSHNFMDVNNSPAREWIAKRANLIGAVRLPDNAFQENAGTEVVTDILFFQKTATPEENPIWLESKEIELDNPKTGEKSKHFVNQYFNANPRNVLGRETAGGTMYRSDSYTVESTGDVASQLKEFVSRLPQNLYVEPTQRIEVLDNADNTVPDGVKVGTYYTDDKGVIRQRLTDVMNNKRSLVWEAPNDGALNRMKGMMALRDTLRAQMRLERSLDASTKDIEKNRELLNKQYDDFLKKYGYLNSMTNRRLFMDDTESALLQALELDYDQGVSKAKALSTGMEEKPASAQKADIFKQRVLFPPSDVINVNNAKDALLASLNVKGMVDIDYMADVYNKPVAEIVSELGDVLYNDPQKGYVTADEYLSGDVKTKLAEAISAAKQNNEFQRNVTALEKVIPKDKLPSEIYASVGANWIPRKVYAEFASEITGIPADNIDFRYVAATAVWVNERTGSGDVGKMTSDFGTEKVNAFDLLAMMMNGKSPEVKYTVRNADGSTSTHTDIEATEAAREKYQKIKETWESWLFSDANRADELATIYNDKHNRTVARKFDGSHMTFAGMTPVMNGKPFAGLRPHQKDVVWRAIQDRNVLLDHVVGAGKTMAMAATAMEMRRLGIARKPLFVVPNHLTLQWRSEFTKLYPASNILAATPDDFAKDKREAMFSKMVTGNYDAIIIGHSSLKKVGLPAEVEARMYDQQVEEIANAIEDIKRERGDRGIVRDMEKIKTTLENKIKDLKAKAGKKDDVVNFDELGIDALFVDEMHEFKNLFFTTQMSTSGLGNPKGSGKAFDLFMKIKWMTETFGEDVPLITATGTPVSNSLSEMFTMQRYMKFNEMKRSNLHLFDAWAKQYGEVENVYEVAPSGVGYRQGTRFSKFKNLPSLMGSYTSFADIITLQDLKDQTAQQLDENGKPKKFPVPKLKTGKPINVIAKRSELQTNFFGVPQLAVDENGNIKFEIDPDKAGIEVQENGKWRLSFEGGFSDFETREEAELELVSKALTPQTFLDPESLLGKFANLKQLTKETKGKVNALSLTGLANKAGLDFRIIDPFAPDFPDSKINQSVANMMQEYRTWTKDKGTQIVFCDMSVPNSARASMGSKEKRIYVRDNQRLITHKPKGTLYASEGYEGYPFYMVKEKNGITIYEAVSGIEMPAYGLADRTAAKEWVDRYVQNEAGRDKIFSLRDQYAIDQTQIDEYREEKELEVAEDGSNEITLDDLEAIAGSSKFSVYDDIKAKLMAQGVPESEIAFIHDYNTPKQKDMLFKQVNLGNVRFLFGSTQKLGAGTNVQKRLVALHHIDAPWRPSDLEQREGRIIRQGNELYARDPDGFEVGIYRYATEQTYDTRRWQLLEHKAAGVEQLRKYSGESEIEDIAGEAANSADMKAAASGNPLILEETKLRTEVKRLTNLQKAHADSKYSMARRIKENERAIGETWPNRIKSYQELIATVNQYPIPSDKEQIADIVVDGKRIKGKASAENEIGIVGTKVRQSYLINESRKIVYRGIEFTLERGLNAGEMKLNSPDGLMNYYSIKDGFSPSGLITRMNNYIDSFGDRIEDIRSYIERAKKENESLSTRVDEPFEQADLLKQTQAKHTEVQRKLMKSTSLEAIPEGQRAQFNRILAERKEKLASLGYENALKEAEADDLAFSLVENMGGMPLAEVQSIVNGIKAQWKNTPPIFVVENMQDEVIPESVRKFDAQLKAQGSTGDPAAFISGGKVYILSSMMPNKEFVYEALFHETLGHFGLRGTYGSELNTILDQIALLRSKDVIAKAKEYGFDTKSKADLRRAAEEVLAEMAQKRPEIGFVKRAIAAIRKFLREIGFNIALSDNDIIANYLLPARRFVENGGNMTGMNAFATAYRKTTAFARTNQTETPEFKRWFGDSKVVDAEGKPLIVYHGTTSEFTEFSKEKKGANTGWDNTVHGFFFIGNEQLAREFAEENNTGGTVNVKQVYLSIKNPIDLRLTSVFNNESQASDLVEFVTGGEKKLSSKKALKWLNDNIDISDWSDVSDEFNTPEFNKFITSKGYDGLISNYGNNNAEYVAFEPNQIKSAIGNNGNFDAGNDDIMFMRTPQAVVSDMVAKAAMNSPVLDKAITAISEPSAKSFGLGSNIRTQLDKARQDPKGFGKMFDAAMRFETDARLIAARPAEMAPSIIAPSAESIREAASQIRYGDTAMKDKEFVSSLLFEGTLYGGSVLEGKVFSSDELRAKGATDKQIKMYYEARASVDASLDETAASVAYNMARAYMPFVKDKLRDNPANAKNVIREALNEQYDAMKVRFKAKIDAGTATRETILSDRAEIEKLHEMIDDVKAMFEHVENLQRAGYMPLSRFGKYSVTAFNDSGTVAEFMRFETEAEAKIKQKELAKQYKRVERGVMPTNPSNLFAGADPETVALFIDKVRDIDGVNVNDAVFQEWYRSAVSDRSALKRMLERKGTAGFDTDLEKVLASFLTSNARFAANNYNRGDMLDVLQYLQTDPNYKRKGDVYDEAKQLFDYVQNPADPFTVGRSLMFTWFMGGSIASAAVNMTQPLTMTLPWLNQYVSVTKAAKALKQASSLAGAISFRDKVPEGELGKALLRAREIGLVDPQETHHLYKLGSGGIINRLTLAKDLRTRLTGVATAWGFMFGKAEQFNRYLTFITAWNLAKENNLGNAFEFARRAVEETQGIYSKSNRPNWARGTGSLGAVGAAAFTFKQYSIAYVEMLARMARSGSQGRRAAMLQLGVLFLLAGAMGLPFADDEADILDTMIQFAGGEGNTRRHLREYAFNVLGEDLGMFALYGVTAMMPIDIQGRMGMGNLLPSTALLMPSNSENRGRSALEVFGASGSLVSDSLDAVQGLENGKDFVDVIKQFAPVAVKNVFKGADMLEDGFYADTRGRRVIDTTDADAFWKSIGFQPINVSKAQKQVQGNQQSIARTKQRESAIADLFAKARFENDPAKAQKAREMLEEWNEAHPDLPIVITPRQVLNRVRAMAMTREERQMRATPRELRGTLL